MSSMHCGCLADASEVTEDMLSALATFVSAAYSPKGIQIDSIPELRWYLFCRHMAESDKLPPTLGPLKQHILRARIQARVWGQASIAQQELLDPLQHGYYMDNDGLVKPITSQVLPAPEAIIELVRCRCNLDCSSDRCSCRSKDLRPILCKNQKFPIGVRHAKSLILFKLSPFYCHHAYII